jgi:hypothetical protein
LSDIELSRIPPPDIIKRASRLARLLDDTEALEWLSQEISDFTLNDNGFLSPAASRAVSRSNRENEDKAEDGKTTYWTASLERLQANAGAGLVHLQGRGKRPATGTGPGDARGSNARCVCLR